ncbi:MAG: HNH endonuclease [Calditrichia bacterium]
MSDWIDIKSDKKHIAREKQKAREMRKSRWWKDLLVAGICHYCEGKFPADQLTMDHVVPMARGGKSTKGNIVACCKPCNNDKKYLTPAEMLMKKLQKASDSGVDEHTSREE